MWQQLLPGLRIKLFMTLVLGILYPLAITGISQLFFPHQANGSLITENGKVIGSQLIGQSFALPEYFHSRPSNAGANGYDATASGGFNQGPTSKKLVDRVAAAVERFNAENPGHGGPIPADLVTGSASGLDPHISPDAARAQAGRVAKLRGAPLERVNELIAQFIETPDLGVLGEPRVNVLLLDLELNRRFPMQSSSSPK